MLSLVLALLAVPLEPPPAGLAIDGTLIIVWHEGEVTCAPVDGDAAPSAPLIGEALTADTRVEAADGGRLQILIAGDRLLTLDGPGAWVVASGQVHPLASTHPGVPRAPQLEPLATYREGPLPTLEAGSSQPLLGDTSLPPTLLITHPVVPVTRQERPDIRWHWPYEDGRFDLVLEEVDAEGAPLRVIERWRNLAGRSHRLWAPLERGLAYRVRVAHRTDEDGATPISDQRVFHVLAPSEIAAVDGALASLDALQYDARSYRPEVEVLRARLLESHGLWDEAEAVWTGLTLRYPSKDELLHQALRLHARSLTR